MARLVRQKTFDTPVNSIRLAPQEGPQTAFLQSMADIVIYGGSAGSGKSYALLLEGLRWTPSIPSFTTVIFRRVSPEITNPGGLWDESMTMYGQLSDAEPKLSKLEWHFRDGGRLKFGHLEHETSVYEWHGSQLAFIGFDELTTFTQFQFFYMLSRNRSTSGVRPYVRATCNPDADSWVAEFISWWIDQTTGFPIAERAGVVRWFMRVGDKLVWANDPSELMPERLGLPRYTADGTEIPYEPKSVTFIPATIFNNQELLKKDPEYLANLLALPTVQRERLLNGNWKIRPAPGLMFQRQWCEVIEPDRLPPKLIVKRGWDLAATPKTATNNPDWTCGTKMAKDEDGVFYVLDHVRMRASAGDVEKAIRNLATQDGVSCEVCMPQDPGQAGKAQVLYYAKALAGFTLRWSPEQGDKVSRFGPFSSQAQAGNVKIVRGPWNEEFFRNLEMLPDSGLDDGDSVSRAFNSFFDGTTGLLEYYQKKAKEKMEIFAANNKAKEMPTLANGGVRVKGPAGVNVIYDRRGRPIFCNAQGIFVVDPQQVVNLTRAGFTVVEETKQ